MTKYQKLFEKTYAPSVEQQQEIVDLCDEHLEAIVKSHGYLYAQGWRDYMLPFMGIGAGIGVAIGFIIGKLTR